MAMAADLGRGQAMDLRCALQDGRAVLAGGPGLGSQMILLRNDVGGSTTAQHVRGNAGSEEFNFPMQGFTGKYDDLNRTSIKSLGFAGPMPQDPKRATGVNSVPVPSAYAASTFSSGLGLQSMDYVHRGGVASSDTLMQAHPYAQSNPGLVSNIEVSGHTAGAQQGFLLHSFGIGSSTEMPVKAQPSPAEEPLVSGFSAAPGFVSYSQGSSFEDDRRLSMVHEYGNGSISHPQHPTSHFQPGYHHLGQLLPVSLDQVSSHDIAYPRVQERGSELQNLREIEMQNVWRTQLDMDLQRRQYYQLQQQDQNLQQRNATNPANMRKGYKFPKYFQKSGMKKKPKLPPVAGSGGPGWCNICQTDCNTAEILQQHITGKKHKKKLQQVDKEGKNAVGKASAAENLMKIPNLNKIATNIHESKSESGLSDATIIKKPESCLGLRKHDNVNVEGSSIEPSAKRPHLFFEIGIIQEPQPVQRLPLLNERCDICNIACNSKSVLESHVRGKKHAAKVNKLSNSANHVKESKDEIKGNYLSHHHTILKETVRPITNVVNNDEPRPEAERQGA
ncbi:hypothetical protein O6H91_16G068500 [Diphasiastrum complanatum]|uniref:Uncharacterized protein n=1 Tax=Diphasiastrum complanatum TaxID=34168 RepID=A0ACC2BDC3_DIPCM|nr:hypothetical protein O6H91_16G068500 [Diphasiastrum complanatum]